MRNERTCFESSLKRRGALAAIRQAYGTEGGEDSIEVFVAHHLQELPQDYWEEPLATATPDSAAVIGLLDFRSS